MFKKLFCLIFFVIVLALGQGQARGAYFAIYYDSNYATHWSDQAIVDEIRDYFAAAGYEVLNADELKTWMDARIADGVDSVVIFAQDVVPQTVVETQSADTTIRKYLDAGGKVVFHGDIPFYNQGNPGGGETNWGNTGAQNVLGFLAASAPRDSGNTVQITDDGKEWGLTETWTSVRPADSSVAAAENLTVLAVDNAGHAAAWVKHYVPGDDYRGFVRLFDQNDSQSMKPNLQDMQRVAEYGMSRNPFARRQVPKDGARYEQTWITLTWTPGDFAVSHDVYMGDNFEDVNNGADQAYQGNFETTTLIAGFPGYPFPEGLQPGTTYYWRVDEVNDANAASPWKGPVLSFWIPSTNAYDPVPSDGGRFIEADSTLTWQPGLNSKLHTVYFGDNFDDVNNADGGQLVADTSYTPGALEADKTYYWRVDESNPPTTVKGDVWSFTTRPDIPVNSDPDLIAWWKFDENSGDTALDWSGHGNNVTLVGSQWAEGVFGDSGLHIGSYGAIQNLSYAADDLTAVSVAAWIRTTNGGDQYIISFDRNEYYRLEINGNGGGTGQVGWDVYTSTGQIDYGSVTRVDDGQWHHVVGVYDRGLMTIYIDGIAEPSTTGGVTFGTGNTRFGFVGANSEATGFDGNRGSGSPVSGEVDDIRIYHRALTQAEITEIMLRSDRLVAWDPSPTNGSITGINVANTLTWSAGDGASQHDVYFGVDRNAVAGADASDTSGVYKGRQFGTSYVPEGVTMESGPFYWRVDEVSSDGTIAKGGTWSFTVADYALVEDFESYNDIPAGEAGSNLVYVAWVDGFENPAANGSTMGYVSGASMETGNVHSGRKSVPFQYNNMTAGISEVVRTFTPAQDWTSNGVLTLSLWFAGDPFNVPGQLYVKVNGVQVNYDGNASNLTLSPWQVWNIDLTDIGTNLSRVNTLTIGIQGPGASGILLLDDIRLYAKARELITPVQPDPAGLVAHFALDGNANDSAGNNNGTLQGDPQWVAGYIGGALEFDGSGDWIDCGNDPSLEITGEVSASAWIKIGAAGIDQKVCGNQDGVNGGYKMGINSDKVEFEIRTSSNTAVLNRNVTGGTILQVGVWYHVVGVYSQQEGYIRTYVNGLLDRELLTNEVFGASPGNLYIGCEPYNNSVGNFNGDMDDIRIYNHALSYEEIAGLAGRTQPIDKPF